MSRTTSRSRRKVLVGIIILVALGFIVLDRGGRVSARLRMVSAHVLAPSQSWLRGATLGLIGRQVPAGDDGAPPVSEADRLRRQLQAAEATVAQLTADKDRLQRQLADMRRVAKALADYPLDLVAADVLSRDYLLPDGGLKVAAGTRRGLSKGQWVVYRYVSRGEDAGVHPGQPVVTAHGIAGLVEDAGANVCLVRLVTSADCRLAARIVHWDSTASRWVALPDVGMVSGSGDGRTLQVRQVPGASDVRPGDYVVTASAETGLPDSLIIGQVTEVSRRPTDLTLTIVARPQVDLDRLDHVWALVPRGPAPR